METRETISVRCSLRAVRWVLSVCLLLSAGSAAARSQGIAAMLVLQRTGFVLRSKDATIPSPVPPTCPAADSSITFDDGVHTQTFALPCANWIDRGTLARYQNSSASGGPSEVRVVRTKAGSSGPLPGGSGDSPSRPGRRRSMSWSISVARTNATACRSVASGMGDGSASPTRPPVPARCVATTRSIPARPATGPRTPHAPTIASPTAHVPRRAR
jgi:hypothetical protein